MFDVLGKAMDGKPNSVLREDGNHGPELSNGKVLEAEYRVPYLAHATMEPMNTAALYTGDALEIWSGNQAPVLIRDQAASAVGLRKKAVTVHTTLMGGGFGRRAEADFSVLAARVHVALAAQAVQVT